MEPISRPIDTAANLLKIIRILYHILCDIVLNKFSSFFSYHFRVFISLLCAVNMSGTLRKNNLH